MTNICTGRFDCRLCTTHDAVFPCASLTPEELERRIAEQRKVLPSTSVLVERATLERWFNDGLPRFSREVAALAAIDGVLK